MTKGDILFKTGHGAFSYRAAGVWIYEGHVLLQRAGSDPAYAVPGGHVRLGETGARALAREFHEEMGVEIEAQELLWIGENFFPRGGRDYHQICLYYRVDGEPPPCLALHAADELEREAVALEFSWVDLKRLDEIELYPLPVKELLAQPAVGIAHFVFKEVSPDQD